MVHSFNFNGSELARNKHELDSGAHHENGM